ncbi:MAG TPA: glycosyl transferase [Clostridia bacterium]|nr:glycosyl transferase [Clostridia bacterium]
MKFGHFDDAKREYVIHTPATPLPWINYLGSESFFSLVSNTGGGYCFYRDAKMLRLIRYRYNSVPADIGGRFFYVKEDGKHAWSPTFHPCDTPLDKYTCRHGMGYTVFESEKDSLQAELTLFVPVGENAEVQKLTVKNASGKPKSFKLYGAVEWCLWNAVDDAANFQRNFNIGEVEIEGNAVYHTTEYRERRNHYAYYGVNASISGFDTVRDAFLGQFGDYKAPKAVDKGTSFSSVAHGWAPIAALRMDDMLLPGEEKTFIFVLGYGENEKEQKFTAPNVIRKHDAKRVLEKFSKPDAVQHALNVLAAYWEGLLTRYTVHSGDDRLDRMVNIWNQYQCMVTFNISRSASYFESGTGRGMGFRDSCQDLLGFVHLVPERARERIIDIASIQKEDGSTYHQYQPLNKRGNNDVGTGFNDDPLWLVACTYAYIAETGDFSILNVPTPFDNKPGSEKPLFEHLRRSVFFTVRNIGPHGLPLIGRADWNDCLNLNCFSEEPGESFQTTANFESGVAESVFIAGMFVKYAAKYAELLERFGQNGEAKVVKIEVANMQRAIYENAWDGSWFLRAYDAFGNVVGSKTCEEGQIFIESQGMCVMAGIGLHDGKARRALDSVRERLMGDFGVELLTPCYTKYRKELGEITSYPPGYKENGSVFCHNNPWVSIAETALDNGDNAFDFYKRTCPSYLEEKSEIRRTEPYVYAQTVAGRSSYSEGEAKNSWLTGTAAWTFVNISQYILGVKPTLDGLKIRPCLPKELNELTIERVYRGANYRIKIEKTGVYSLKANGEELLGDVIPYDPTKVTIEVEVTV